MNTNNRQELLFGTTLCEVAHAIGKVGSQENLESYLEQVRLLQDSARQYHLLGVLYVTLLLEGGMQNLAQQDRALNQSECDALSLWPTFLLDEVLDVRAARPHPDWNVLHALRGQEWFPSIPNNYVEVIEKRLVEDRILVADGLVPFSRQPEIETVAMPESTGSILARRDGVAPKAVVDARGHHVQ